MYVVCYDIESNRCRNKVAKELESYGIRVQYSVFECDISEKRVKELYGKLMKLVKEEEHADIRIYPVCEKCRKKIQMIGAEETRDPKKMEVIVV